MKMNVQHMVVDRWTSGGVCMLVPLQLLGVGGEVLRHLHRSLVDFAVHAIGLDYRRDSM